MAAAAQDKSPTVTVASDKMSAQLTVPPDCDPGMLTVPMLKEIIRGRGVEVTDFTSNAINELIQSKPSGDQAVTIDIACAQPPVDGTDGYIKWIVDEAGTDDQADSGRAADSTDGKNQTEDDTTNVSFYDQSAFVMVQAGDTVAQIYDAVLGEDGRDVTGNTTPAKSGKDVQLQTDETLMRKADGSLIAQQDGVLYREAGKAQIRKRIEIKDYVDFSTGNIDFDGDITIGRGIRDCFKVQATGNIEVKGLIEAATIETGKDLLANGGFAGRERGFANIGGDLKGKYLDNVQGHVKQNLCIDREVINCELTIDGGIDSPQGSIIGGNITPTGEIIIGTLGSGAGVETILTIGSVPMLDPFAEKLDVIVEAFTKDVDKLTEEQNIINTMSAKGRMTATDKERQTEIMFELSTINTSLLKAQRTLDSVRSEIEKRSCTRITIHRSVNPGTVLIYNHLKHKFNTELKGPAEISVDNNNKLVFRQGGSEYYPLTQVAEIQATRHNANAA